MSVRTFTLAAMGVTAATAGASAAFLADCGGGEGNMFKPGTIPSVDSGTVVGKGGNEATITVPTKIPGVVATFTVAPTSTEAPRPTNTPVPPTATPRPTEVPQPQGLSYSEVKAVVNQALVTLPQTPDTKSIQDKLDSIGAMLNGTDLSSIGGTYNTYSAAGDALIRLACSMPTNEQLAKAVFSLKATAVAFVKLHEGKELTTTASADYARLTFRIPADCQNKFLAR
jgi:hypothetical protein